LGLYSYCQLDLLSLGAQGQIIFNRLHIQLDRLSNVLDRLFFALSFADAPRKGRNKRCDPPSLLGSNTTLSFMDALFNACARITN
jgi:hypothetical protein